MPRTFLGETGWELEMVKGVPNVASTLRYQIGWKNIKPGFQVQKKKLHQQSNTIHKPYIYIIQYNGRLQQTIFIRQNNCAFPQIPEHFTSRPSKLGIRSKTIQSFVLLDLYSWRKLHGGRGHRKWGGPQLTRQIAPFILDKSAKNDESWELYGVHIVDMVCFLIPGYLQYMSFLWIRST